MTESEPPDGTPPEPREWSPPGQEDVPGDFSSPRPPVPPLLAPTMAPVPLHMARRTSPLSIAYEMVAVLAGVLLLVGTVDQDWLFVFSIFSSLTGLVALVFRWWFRTYTVTEERLLLDEGVLQRRNRVVPFARVQQVNVNQELLHRPFGLAALHVETAGEGGASSVELRVLKRSDAEALRAYVLDRRHELERANAGGVAADRDLVAHASRGGEQAGGVLPVVVERPLGRMAPKDLVFAGVTHSTVLAAVGVYVVLVTPWVSIVLAEETGSPLPVALQTVGILLAGTVIVGGFAAAVSLTGSFVSDWNWTLSDHGDDLHVRRGLLEVRSQSLPRKRVQQVTIVDNPVRRMLGVVSVTLHTAAMPGSHQAMMVQVPLVKRSELDEFLSALMGPAWVLPELQPRTEPARWRAIRRRALLLLVVFGTPVLWWPSILWVMLALVVLAWPWGQTAHRRAGRAITENRVVFASGVLHHRIDIAPRDRLQSTRVSTSPLQRRVGLATLYADLAGTTWRGPLRMSARLFDVDASPALRLARDLPVAPTATAEQVSG